MNLINTLGTVVSKEDPMDVGTGALYSVVAILMVFVILLIIIGVTTLVFKANGLFEMKKQLDASKKGSQAPVAAAPVASTNNEPVNITDDDMMAAVLVATIDYRNEIKKDVKVVSVREIK